MGEILYFKTEEAAQACLSDIEDRSMVLLAEAGYDVDFRNRIVYGKNLRTKKTDLKAKTERWDTVRKHPDRKGYFFKSPILKYPEYYDILTDGHDFLVMESPQKEGE